MKTKRRTPELNTGSMADIAFLLLIFFLVTAMIPNDKGINRKLPRLCDTPDCDEVEINERNIFQISINKNDAIMINNEVTSIDTITEKAIAFIDNNGDKTCDYCNGIGLAAQSDNPKKAVISIVTDRATNYKTFIAVQDALTKAYFNLRLIYANKHFNKAIEDLTPEELKEIKQAYPFIISEAETR